MINVQELRVGNWISFKGLWMGEISKLSPYSVEVKDNDNFYPLDCFNPIPLTPEVLERCGFESINETHRIGIGYMVFYCYPVGDVYQHWYLYHNNIRITSGIKSLHQLMNLYFALTGQELNYTP